MKKTKHGKNLLIWKCHLTKTNKRGVFRYQIAATKSFFDVHSQKRSILSATSILSCSPMAYNTTASLEQLACADFVDFGKCREIWTIFWSKSDSIHLDVKLRVFRKDDNKELRLVQNLTMGEVDFNQFMRMRNWVVIAAENIARDENLSPVVIPTLSKDQRQG